MINKQVDWVCAKNKFFAQIIHPKNYPWINENRM